MLRIIGIVAAAIFTAAAGTQAQAASFNYKINGYPKDAGDCHQLAAAFGPTFAQATGLAVTKSECTAITDYGYAIDITYTADAAVQPVSTLDLRNGLDARGAFLSDADCRVALATEIQHFQTATGLTPFVSYCFLDLHSADFPYAIRIESFGTPAETPFVDSGITFGAPADTTPEAIEQTLLAGLKARSVDVSYVRYTDEGGDDRTFIFYYGNARIHLSAPALGTLQTAEQCTAEAAQFATAVAGSADAPLVTYCSNDDIMQEFYLNALILDHPTLGFEAAAEQYGSYDDCATARPAAIQEYRTTHGRPVLGAVCGDDPLIGEGVWKLMLIETRSSP